MDNLPRELIEALANKRCVLWAGSGLSVAAGYPTWERLLANLVDDLGRNRRIPPTSTKEIEEALKEKRYPDVAEAVSVILAESDSLGGRIKDALLQADGSWPHAKRHRATVVHRSLTRLPFCMAISPNYDDLLESEWKLNSPPNSVRVADSNKPEAYLDSLSESETPFTIIKTHGHLNPPAGHPNPRDSMVLTATHYRQETHGNRPFRDYLKTLLMTRVFLFVGAGLRDPDLLNVLDDIATSYGSYGSTSRHYAILPHDEVGPLRTQLLLNTYGIKVLAYTRHHDRPLSPYETAVHQVTRLDNQLRRLSGALAKHRVARRRRDASYVSTPSKPFALDSTVRTLFSRRARLEQLFEEACALTDSFRGDLCLAESGETSDISYFKQTGQTKRSHEGEDVHPLSVIGKTFYLGTSDGIYIEDVSLLQESTRRRTPDPNQKPWLRELKERFGRFEYEECSEKTESEFAVPIIANGQRIGVLNLESESKQGYTKDHQAAAKALAHEIGLVVAHAAQRQEATIWYSDLRHENIEEYFHAHPFLKDVVPGERDKRPLRLLILPADYKEGRLTVESPASPDMFSFEGTGTEPFLLRVFREEEPILLTHAIEGAKAQIASPHCQKIFDIKGELLGVPIFSHGMIVGVLACWPMLEDTETRGEYHETHSYFTSKVRGAISRTTNLAVATANDGHGRECALSYLRAIDQASSKEALLEAFMSHYKEARRCLMYSVESQADDSESKVARPILCRDREGPVALPSDHELRGDNAYFLYTFWRSRGRFYAEQTPMRFFQESGAEKMARPLGETWLTAPIVSIVGEVRNEKKDVKRDRSGKVLVQVIHPKVEKVLGFLEVESELLKERGPGEPVSTTERNRIERVSWALNVLTNVLAQQMGGGDKPPSSRRPGEPAPGKDMQVDVKD